MPVPFVIYTIKTKDKKSLKAGDEINFKIENGDKRYSAVVLQVTHEDTFVIAPFEYVQSRKTKYVGRIHFLPTTRLALPEIVAYHNQEGIEFKGI